jgi:hypothetical protein
MCGHWLGHQTLHTKSRILPSQQKQQQHKESNDSISPGLKRKHCAQTVLGPTVGQWSKPKLAKPHLLPEYRKNQKTNGVGKELERKTKTRDWAIGKHGTLTNKQRNCNLVTQRKIEHLPQKAGHSKKTNGRSLFGLAL